MSRRITIGPPDGIRVIADVPDGSDTTYSQEQQTTPRLSPQAVINTLQLKIYNMLPKPFAEFTEAIRIRIARSVALAASQGLHAAVDNPPKYRRGSGSGVGGHIVEHADPSPYEV